MPKNDSRWAFHKTVPFLQCYMLLHTLVVAPAVSKRCFSCRYLYWIHTWDKVSTESIRETTCGSATMSLNKLEAIQVSVTLCIVIPIILAESTNMLKFVDNVKNIGKRPRLVLKQATSQGTSQKDWLQKKTCWGLHPSVGTARNCIKQFREERNWVFSSFKWLNLNLIPEHEMQLDTSATKRVESA